MNKKFLKLVDFLVIGVMALSIIALVDDSDIRNAVLLTFGVYGIGMLIYCWFILVPEIRREKESDPEKEESNGEGEDSDED